MELLMAVICYNLVKIQQFFYLDPRWKHSGTGFGDELGIDGNVDV